MTHDKPQIHPETGDIVDEISRTTELRVAKNLSEAEHRRAVADIIVTMTDRAERKGCRNGLIAGVAIGMVLMGVIIYLALWHLGA